MTDLVGKRTSAKTAEGSQEPPLFSVARDCGHWTRVSGKPSAGIEWCEICGGYRGVIVMQHRPKSTHTKEKHMTTTVQTPQMTPFDKAMAVLIAIAENVRVADEVRVDAAKAVLQAHRI